MHFWRIALALVFGCFGNLSVAPAAEQFLPIRASTWGKAMNPLLEELDVGFPLSPPTCDDKNNLPRRVCSFRIGHLASVIAAVPQESDRVLTLNLVCRPRDQTDPLRCLVIFALALRSVSPSQSIEAVGSWMKALRAIVEANAVGSIWVDGKEISISTVLNPELSIRPASRP
jgi:hypothetical protein